MVLEQQVEWNSDYALSQLAQYSPMFELIRQKLRYTNDEENRWATYTFEDQRHQMTLFLAYDSEESPEIIHIKIKTVSDLKPKLEALDLFQCLFEQLDVVDTKNTLEK